jgi:hypothetical protein
MISSRVAPSDRIRFTVASTSRMTAYSRWRGSSSIESISKPAALIFRRTYSGAVSSSSAFSFSLSFS